MSFGGNANAAADGNCSVSADQGYERLPCRDLVEKRLKTALQYSLIFRRDPNQTFRRIAKSYELIGEIIRDLPDWLMLLEQANLMGKLPG